MAREKKVNIEKMVSRGKKEKQERKDKKSKAKRVKKEKIQPEESFDTLIIDNVAYKTQLTKKYLNRRKFETHNPNKLTAFIPGTILDIFVNTGQKVVKGEDLLILEAMKMNNKIIAPHNAIVKKIYVKSGEMVTREQLLIELKS